jgi:hypothetical protein
MSYVAATLLMYAPEEVHRSRLVCLGAAIDGVRSCVCVCAGRLLAAGRASAQPGPLSPLYAIALGTATDAVADPFAVRTTARLRSELVGPPGPGARVWRAVAAGRARGGGACGQYS